LDVTSYHNEFKANGPGVVIGRKGTLGSVHFSESDHWPHDATLWSKDLRGNNPRFVYYYLHALDFKRFDVGNSNPTLNRNHIHDLSVLIPPLGIQERIADLLSASNDLIENNRRRIPLLEEAARILCDLHEICAPMFRQILTLSLQNDKLRTARDLLLPRLMSGEVVA